MVWFWAVMTGPRLFWKFCVFSPNVVATQTPTAARNLKDRFGETEVTEGVQKDAAEAVSECKWRRSKGRTWINLLEHSELYYFPTASGLQSVCRNIVGCLCLLRENMIRHNSFRKQPSNCTITILYKMTQWSYPRWIKSHNPCLRQCLQPQLKCGDEASPANSS